MNDGLRAARFRPPSQGQPGILARLGGLPVRTALLIIGLALSAALLGGCGCFDIEKTPGCSDSGPYGVTPEVPRFKEGGKGWR